MRTFLRVGCRLRRHLVDRVTIRQAALVWLVAMAIPAILRAQESDDAKLEFFEKKIRPLLVANCFECHGEGQAKGGLNLETGEAAKRGGDSGPVFIPGKPDESLLFDAINHTGDLKMPPKSKLADAEIADLRRWIEIGAPWPAGREAASAAATPFAITPEQREFWSFQPVHEPALPAVRDTAWPQTSIDRFILAALDARELTPSPPADKRTLLRRATFDLIGLPPTPEEIDAFLADDATDAFARVVDRLLASPHYGERWGRLWLDVARYGEDQAHTFQARLYPNGYRYRDWVVRAVNDDLPYDQFVIQQIAGDLLDAPEEAKHDREIALGYFALGPVYYADAGCAAKAALDELDDRVDTLARGFLGLTIACARCHDHKFDPISQQDYYALAGIFRSTAYREAPLAPREVVEKYEQAQAEIKSQEQSVERYLENLGTRLSEAAAGELTRYMLAVWKLQHPVPGAAPVSREELAKQSGLHDFILERCQKLLAAEAKGRLTQLETWFDLLARAESLPAGENGVPAEVAAAAEGFQKSVLAALAEQKRLQSEYEATVAAASEEEKSKVARPELDKLQADLLSAIISRRGLLAIPKDKLEPLLDEAAKKELGELRGKVEQLKKSAPPKYPFAHSLAEGQAGNMKLHIRGNPNRTADEVPRRFLAILSGESSAPFSQGSGRLELARAIASPDNPLTARVIVNRIWQHHFGRGIVGTPSNFGSLGERPTHPELLDYLAARFVAQGWSLKALHREIMLTSAYRQSSAHDARKFEVDPDNRLLWRMSRRRLDVESWRDALLAVAGNLDPAVGGPPGNLAEPGFLRRTMYGTVSRHNLDGFLRLFDFPDPNITSEKRTVTTVPLQQLFVLNSENVIRQAQALVARLASEAGSDDASRIRRAYRLLYGREANDPEVAAGLEFLASPDEAAETEGAAAKSELSRWEQYTHVLLGANEMTFVD